MSGPKDWANEPPSAPKAYNHTREDSPLLPCPLCAATDAERELAEVLAVERRLDRTLDAARQDLDRARQDLDRALKARDATAAHLQNPEADRLGISRLYQQDYISEKRYTKLMKRWHGRHSPAATTSDLEANGVNVVTQERMDRALAETQARRDPTSRQCVPARDDDSDLCPFQGYRKGTGVHLIWCSRVRDHEGLCVFERTVHRPGSFDR